MFCKNCGKEIPSTASFCKFCGTKIVENNEKDVKEETAKKVENSYTNLNNNNVKASDTEKGNKINVLSIISLVGSLISMWFCLAEIIQKESNIAWDSMALVTMFFGYLALKQIKEKNEKGHVLAMAGIIISSIIIIIYCFITMLAMVNVL